MQTSRYYLDESEPGMQDPQHHARNLRSLLIMAEYSAMHMVMAREYFGDRIDDFQQSLNKITNLLNGTHE
jgi:hypothetical protein